MKKAEEITPLLYHRTGPCFCIQMVSDRIECFECSKVRLRSRGNTMGNWVKLSMKDTSSEIQVSAHREGLWRSEWMSSRGQFLRLRIGKDCHASCQTDRLAKGSEWVPANDKARYKLLRRMHSSLMYDWWQSLLCHNEASIAKLDDAVWIDDGRPIGTVVPQICAIWRIDSSSEETAQEWMKLITVSRKTTENSLFESNTAQKGWWGRSAHEKTLENSIGCSFSPQLWHKHHWPIPDLNRQW